MADHDHDHDPDKGERYPPIAVLFQSREEARAAVKALHKAKYTHTWLGTTSVAATPGGDVLTVESGGFFSGTQSLVDALVSHGVHGEAARNLEELVEPGNALLTVDPKTKDPEEALAIIEAHGGQSASARSAATWPGWASTTTFDDVELESEDEFEEMHYSRR